MNIKIEEICPICNSEECVCEKEPKVAVKKHINFNCDCDYDCDCDCDYDCDCDCDCDDEFVHEGKKKNLVLLGATVVAVGVAGGILYFVKNKK